MAGMTPDLEYGLKQEARARESLGMMSEQLTGRSMEIFFESRPRKRTYTYAFAQDVDFNKRTEIDCRRSDRDPGKQPDYASLMSRGLRHHRDPESARHALDRGRYPEPAEPDYRRLDRVFLDRADRRPECAGHRPGRLVLRREHDGRDGRHREKRRRSTFGAAIRGGDLVCKGSCGQPHRDRPEGRHHHRRRRYRHALGFHDAARAAWSYAAMRARTWETRCMTARSMSAAASAASASMRSRPN